jgi:glycosyltransferase involved in cell wall biosynthesis
MLRKVLIVQEYIPQYRLPFFEMLVRQGRDIGVDISVAYGTPGARNRARNDAVDFSGGIRIEQRERQILGKRLVFRFLPASAEAMDLLILEQARRNLDLYRLLLPRYRSVNPKVALWGHGRDYTHSPSWIDRKLQVFLLKKADWFFAYTEGGKQSALKYGFDESKVSVVQNSIDTESLKTAVSEVGNATIELFEEKNDLRRKTALFLGALDSSKRLDFLFEASDIAASQDSDFRLLIAGDGPSRQDVEEWTRCRTFATYLGTLEGPSKALALASSQVMTMPGRVGLASVDSFASGVPLVSTRWPWHAPEFEYLIDGVNALVTEDNTEAYGYSLIELLNDSERLQSMVDNAKADGLEYTLESMVERFLSGIIGALDGARN